VMSLWYWLFPETLLEEIIKARKEYLEIELSEGCYELPTMAAYPATLVPDYSYNFREEVAKTLNVKWCGESIELGEFMQLVEEYSRYSYKENKFIYPIISPINLMHRPSTAPSNLVCALFKRSFNDPYINTNFNQQVYNNKWRELYSERVNLYDTPYVESYTFLEAIANMDNVKRKRLIKAQLEDLMNGAQPEYKKSVSVKHDELIAVKWSNGLPTFKPRAIVQFSPDYIKDGTQFSHTMTDVLHDMYNVEKIYYVKNFFGNTVKVSYVFDSGYTADQLNVVMSVALSDPDRVFYIVAGDDAYVVWGPLGVYYGPFGEQDFSMYDHTQGTGPMKGDELKFQNMDVPIEHIKRKKFGCESKYKVRARYGNVTLQLCADAGVQMPSGDPLTTYGNSDHNIDEGHGLIRAAGSGKTIPEVSLEYGFVMKHRVFYEPSQGTFLKGWWVTLENGSPFWLPLPSMVLKIGKVLKDPCQIAKVKDVNLAYRMCLYALARSPGVIPFSYPILGPFIKKMLELGVESSLRLNHRFKRIEVSYTDQNLDLEKN